MCAIKHEKQLNPVYSRIKVYQFYLGPIDVPIVCQYCEDRPCVRACPTGALTYNTETFQSKVDEALCTGCRACNQSCLDNGRGGCITFHPRTDKAQIYDLCDGDPQCVKYCPSDTLHYFPSSRFPKRLAKPPELIAKQIANQFYPVKKEID